MGKKVEKNVQVTYWFCVYNIKKCPQRLPNTYFKDLVTLNSPVDNNRLVSIRISSLYAAKTCRLSTTRLANYLNCKVLTICRNSLDLI